jgi:hypothetical protein
MAPGMRPGRIDIDHQGIGVLFQRDHHLASGWPPMLAQGTVRQILAIELPALGRPPRVDLTAPPGIAVGAPTQRRSLDLLHAQELAAQRATAAVAARQDLSCHFSLRGDVAGAEREQEVMLNSGRGGTSSLQAGSMAFYRRAPRSMLFAGSSTVAQLRLG